MRKAGLIEYVPARLTIVLLGASSFLFLANAQVAVGVDFLIIALAILDARRTQPPEVERKAPRLSALGAATQVLLTVTNSSLRSVTTRVTDDLDACLRRAPGSHDAEGDGEGVELTIPPRTSVGWRYQATPRTRGFLELGDVHLRTLSPLKLVWRRTKVELTHTLQVQPGVHDLLRSDGNYAIRHPSALPGLRRTSRWGDGREFESLRDYVQGDDPRTIDWKATAKRRKHVVRNYETERSQNIVLAIDAGRYMRERLSPVRERIDYALGACMLLASRAQRFGDRVGTLVFDNRIRHVSPARRTDPAALAKVLAGVETRLVEPDYPLALATLGRHFRKRSLVILFCDVIDPAVSSALVRSLARTGRSHLPLAIAIQNPELEQVASGEVRHRTDAYDRAAAEELVQARAMTLHLMRQSGIIVVDTPPGDTLTRTLDKYVEIKERGLL